jgi:hypothetical protein
MMRTGSIKGSDHDRQMTSKLEVYDNDKKE